MERIYDQSDVVIFSSLIHQEHIFFSAITAPFFFNLTWKEEETFGKHSEKEKYFDSC